MKTSFKKARDMKIGYYVMLLFFWGAVACSNESEPIIPDDGPDQSDSTDYKIDKETLYLMQSDKERILNSLFKYDETKKSYILDLTKEDAAVLGISEESYANAEKCVQLINEADIMAE